MTYSRMDRDIKRIIVPQILKREDYNRDEEGGEQAGEINCGGKVKRNGKNSCACNKCFDLRFNFN